jgi:hypothetical protein
MAFIQHIYSIPAQIKNKMHYFYSFLQEICANEKRTKSNYFRYRGFFNPCTVKKVRFPSRESLGSDIPAGEGKTANLFYSVVKDGKFVSYHETLISVSNLLNATCKADYAVKITISSYKQVSRLVNVNAKSLSLLSLGFTLHNLELSEG